MSSMEFLIYEVFHDGGGPRVSGIVNKGSVSLGAEFVAVRDGSGSSNPVKLKVSKIIAYRREITELPTGMSGELHVDGNGIGQLEGGGMLMD